MSFQFGFSGDDIEDDNVDQKLEEDNDINVTHMNFMNNDIPIESDYIPKLFSTKDLLLTQSPIRMSYSIVNLGNGISIPRRDLYDVKYQLMRQESLSTTDQILLGTTNEDVRATTYEGGLKVWECSFDMIKVLSEQLTESPKSILELGCGAAIPSSFIFYNILSSGISNVKLILADYNESVLRLVTAPNMFLTWVCVNKKVADENIDEIDITPELIDEFENDLSNRGIELEYISGAWSPQFVRLLNSKFQLVLGSETIYSLDTLPVFTDTLLNCIDQSNNGYALVAAKKIYFGVGGGIPDFINALDQRQATHSSVFEDASGVGRAVLKVAF